MEGQGNLIRSPVSFCAGALAQVTGVFVPFVGPALGE